jgi:hypothetical protein
LRGAIFAAIGGAVLSACNVGALELFDSGTGTTPGVDAARDGGALDAIAGDATDSDDDAMPIDAAEDAAERDAGEHASTDAARDAASDAAIDAGKDAAPDAAPDAMPTDAVPRDAIAMDAAILDAMPPDTGQPEELIVNGGFENGTTGWMLTGEVVATATTVDPHTGVRALLVSSWTGTTEIIGDTSATQEVAIPANASTAMLSFWANLRLGDGNGTDDQEALILDGSGTVLITVFDMSVNQGVWQHFTVNLMQYAGTSVEVVFRIHSSSAGSDPVLMEIDDVSLLVQ